MIKAIFFDGGGVISHFDENVIDDFEQEQGLREGEIWNALYSGSEWKQAELGAIDEDTWFAAGIERLSGWGNRVAMGDLRAVWGKCFLKIDTEVLALAQDLSKSYRVGLLTNSSSSQAHLEEKLASAGLYDVWHTVVNSAHVGVAKPDVRIYEIAARQIGMAPSECLHIDDKPENVAGAQEAGFQGIHHDRDCAALESSLRRLGIRLVGRG
jgi:putative hydrolase of the HAD superfamily